MTDKAPDAYRTISEAGEETGLPAHVLRFWESRFTQIKPVKRAGGRRLYRRQDIQLLNGLKKLLYEEGYTIKGAQKYLKDHGVAQVCAIGQGAAPEAVSTVAETPLSNTEPEAAPVSETGDETGQGSGLFGSLRGLSGEGAEAGPAESGVRSADIEPILEKLSEAKTRLDAALEAHKAAR